MSRFFGTTIPCVAAILLVSSSAWAVGAAMAPTRTTGVAPLSVFFDAAGSTGADPVHELHYAWDFDDSGSGVWSTSGRSKNLATGPWASHVFDQAGTYRVRVTVTDPNGNQASTTRTINVSDPDAFYAGSATTCVSASGNFAGCPAGAVRLTENDFNVGASRRGTRKRVLFRRGDTFTSNGQVVINVPGPATIAAFGSGARPRVNSTQAGLFRLSGKTPLIDDWRIVDLDCHGSNLASSSLVNTGGTIKRVLIYRVSGTRYGAGFSIAHSVITYLGQPEMHDEVAIVDSSLFDLNGKGLYFATNHLTFQGNSVNDTSSHNLRIPHVDKGVISHNQMSAPGSGTSVIKLHAVTLGIPLSFPERESKHFIISHNQLTGDIWSVNLGPQNSITNEHVREGIVENNYFTSSSKTREQLHVWARSISVRNNIFNMNGGAAYSAIAISRRGIEPVPQDNRVYNNSCYTSATAAVACVSATSPAVNTTAINNLVYAPNASSSVAASVSGTMRNNLKASSNPFVSGSPSTPADFRLKAGSQAADVGGAISWRGLDFSGGARPTDGDNDGTAQWDIGAYELGGGGGTVPPPPTAPAAPFLLP
ncbi:MAG: PKD domain-containing protein [bacterium]|nr:PKD domain-containing protein [bacterium]